MQTAGEKLQTEISMKQWLLLAMTECCPEPRTLTNIGNLMGCSRQNVKKLALALEKKGFYADEQGKIFKRANVNEKLIEHSFNFSPIGATGSGAPSTDSDTIWRLSQKTYSKINKRKQKGVEMCKLLMDYSKIAKLKTAFVDGILEQLYSEGKAHPSFNQIGTDSGRLSCSKPY